MSLPKKIAMMIAPIAGIAFLIAVPALAQNTQGSAAPKSQVDASTPKSEAPSKKVKASRRSWSKKHVAGAASGSSPKPKPKPKTANDVK